MSDDQLLFPALHAVTEGFVFFFLETLQSNFNQQVLCTVQEYSSREHVNFLMNLQEVWFA